MKVSRWKFVGFVALLATLSPGSLLAQTLVGGYDIAKIAAETLSILHQKQVVTDVQAKAFEARIVTVPVSPKSNDPLVAAAPLVDLFGQFFRSLVDRGMATEADVADARKAASSSGGVKIGGVNPVVLAASFLDLLSRKGIIPLSQAQKILDTSKR